MTSFSNFLKTSLTIFVTTITSLNSNAQNNFEYPILQSCNDADTFWGVRVEDKYRVLENDKSLTTIEWKKKESEILQQYFKQTKSGWFIEGDIENKLPVYSNIPVKQGSLYFYFYLQNGDLKSGASIYYRSHLLTDENDKRFVNGWAWSEERDTKRLISPNDISGKDKIVFSRNIFLSKNEKYLAVMYNRNGSDWQEIQVIRMEDHEILNDFIVHVKFSEVTWCGNGFYYSKYDSINRYNLHQDRPQHQKVYYHVLGTKQEADELIFQRPSFPDNVFLTKVTDDEKFLIIYERNNEQNDVNVYFKNLTDKSNFIPIAKGLKKSFEIIGSKNDLFYALTNHPNSYNKTIVEIDTKNPLKWELVIPESENFKIESSIFFDNTLVLLYQADTGQYIKTLNIETGKVNLTRLHSDYNFQFKSVDKISGQIFLKSESFFVPHVGWLYDIKKNTLNIIEKTGVDYSPDNYNTIYTKYKSKDGTEIPIYLVTRKGYKRDNNAPAILAAIGGDGIYAKPNFTPEMMPLLDRGGIYAFANIRGGDYIKRDWHEDGRLLKIQNSFDDFYFAAKFLKDSGYVALNRLAITGSGLLVASTVNQHPEMYKAAIPFVGVYDMIRFEKFTGGILWQSEIGNISNESDFKNLLSYSPLHNIKSNTTYPSILVITAEVDDRVPHLHSYKYVAALQEQTKSPNPILLRVEKQAGHYGAIGRDAFLKQERDFNLFLFKELGIEY